MFNRKLPKPSNEFLCVLGLFAVGLCLRLWGLGDFSLQENELSTAKRIGYSFWETIVHLRHGYFPPLHFAILNLWSGVFGKSEWALRFPSAMYSSLTVIVLYKLGKELFNKEVGFIAAALLAFSAYAIGFAQDAKMYALFFLLEGLSFLYFFRFLRNQQSGGVYSYVVATILCCFTMYTGLVVVLTQNLIYWMFMEKNSWRKWLNGQLIIISVCLLWIFYSVHEEQVYLGAAPSIGAYIKFCLTFFFHVIGVPPEFWRFDDSRKLQFWINTWLCSFLVFYFVIDVISNFLRRTGENEMNRRRLLLWVLISTIVYCVFDAFFVHLYLAVRYLGFLQLPILLLLASQVCEFPRFIKNLIMLVLLMMAVNTACIYLRDNLEMPNQDWRRIANDISAELGENGIVLSLLWVSIDYYYKGDPHRFFMITPDECSRRVLEDKGILKPNVDSIYVFYKHDAPDISLDGFEMVRKVTYRQSGYILFRRSAEKKGFLIEGKVL